jgi:subtilase family serine protease
LAARRSVALILFPLLALCAPQERIHSSIENSRTVRLTRILRPEAEPVNDRGPLESWTPIHDLRLTLQPTPQQAADLEQFLEEQRDPSSANFHRWLTPEEYGERFGLNENDLGKITAWLQAQGFSVAGLARARNWVKFSGNAEQVQRAFQVELRRYQTDGEMHFANSTPPAIPAVLAGIVADIRGLDDFHPKPLIRRRLHREFDASSGSHYLAPDDLAAIYNMSALYKAGFDGTGQKLVIAGQTSINLADIRAFRSQFNLPAKDPQMVLAGSDPGIRAGDSEEADLDIEWAGAVARNATIIYVYSQNVFQSVQDAIDQNLAPVISLSYGACEAGIPTSYRSLAQQANAEGITWFSASGDSAAAGCDAQGTSSARKGPAVIFPADIPEVTAVGGTEFNESGGIFWNSQNGANSGSAISYISEKAWNDTALIGGLAGTGGGASVVFPKPWWQTGPGVPTDNARDLPDVALTASANHDGYIIFANGGLMVVGGTSASTPSFAGIVTLVNQYVIAKGLHATPGLGNINPTLYSLAQGTSGVFHDVTVGDNIVPCTSGTSGCANGSFGFKAGTGYDLATGLGSVDAYKLATSWATLPNAIGTTLTLAANPPGINPTATLQLTATVKAVTGSSAPTGTVTFSAGTTQLGSAALANGSASVIVKGSLLDSGANIITASYTATGNFANSSGTTPVTVTTPPAPTNTAVTANPTAISSIGSTQLTATVKSSGAVSPTGSVVFSIGSTILSTAPLSAGTASLMIKASTLASGSNTITATYTATSNFANSSASVVVTVTAPQIPTTTTLSANPAAIASTGTTQVTATVKSASGTAIPAGSVVFTLAGVALGSNPLLNGAASLTVKASTLASGSNTITATYTATSNFANSSASVVVTVTAPQIPTTTTLSVNPAAIASTGTTQVTATVKSASGTAIPTGSIVLTVGNVTLGSAPLSAAGAASFPVKASSLAAGANTITATYSGVAGFNSSIGAKTVTVNPPAAAKVQLTVSPKSSTSVPGYLVTVQLQEQAGVASTVTGFTLNGTDYSALIKPAFGSPVLPAHGNLTANLAIQWSPLPGTLVFGFTGTDTGGTKWTQLFSLATLR